MAPPVTPSSRPTSRDHTATTTTTPSRTPHTKQRLHFPNPKTPNPNHAVPTEHPVEVIGRIRDHPDRKDKQPPSSSSSSLEITDDGRSVRVRTDIGYRDFTLDGVSVSEDEDLAGFYRRFVESRVRGVRLGAKCTVMMYGPTGSGKSHTMFGCAKQQGIVYRALRDILRDGEEDKENDAGGIDDAGFGVGLFVQVAVLEIYNEDIYDLLSGSSGSGAAVGFSKGNVPKARLEVMGKKAKNATHITGNDAGKISREVAKVEKRRIIKSTLCNERSSRSHCMIILDVPSVGGRLMLVDMAGSENLEQAGQTGFEAKMQTAKINQGNTALKRVVESIANGDSHVPFRDSKLTMLLQDSFEDDKSKILMILCASPDPKEMHKTISTFEYGAKAKCIIRVAHVATPRGGDTMNTSDEHSSSAMLGSRIAAMNQFIYKLQMENKQKEKERDDARKELRRKVEELTELRRKMVMIEGGRGPAAAPREEEINSKVDERTLILKLQLEKMEARIGEQQKELVMLRQRLGEEFQRENAPAHDDFSGSGFAKRLAERYPDDGDQGMEKSMEIDMGDQPTTNTIHEVREVVMRSSHKSSSPSLPAIIYEEDSVITGVPKGFCLSTVFEGNEDEEEEAEVEKEVVEEKKAEHGTPDFSKDAAVSRSTRIQNIFRLCGNYRELLAQQVRTPTPKKRTEVVGAEEENSAATPLESKPDNESKRSPISTLQLPFSAVDVNSDVDGKRSADREENSMTGDAPGLVDVYVKWETSKAEMSGNLIKKMKISKEASLTDLRKLIETHLAEVNSQKPFTFLLLGDPTGAPVTKDKEGTVKASKLPICNNQLRGHLACLRPIKNGGQQPNSDHLPLGALENKLAAALCPNSDVPCFGEKENFSPNIGQQNISYLSGLRA